MPAVAPGLPPVVVASSDRTPIALKLAAAGAAIALFALATHTEGDSDLWGHLRFGLDMLRTHALPSVDPYSFTQDLPWVNHEWLSELQMGVAYTIGGVAGLALLKGVLVFLALGLVWLAFAGVDVVPRMLAFGVVALSSAPLSRTLRPQVWSLLCLAMLCRVLVEERARLRPLLPILFLIWANLHGGWIVGLGILGAWAAVDSALTPARLRTWVWIVPLCAIATLVNPYGVGLWRFLYATVGMSRNITEWQPLWTASIADWIPWLATTGVGGWLVWSGDRSRLRPAAVVLMLAYASARVMRLWPLYVECAALVLVPAFRARWPLKSSIAALGRNRGDAVVGGVILAAGFVAAIWLGSSTLRCISLTGTWVPDASAATALDGHRDGRLVVFFDWGEYALWHWGPSLRVSMDGRRETVYSDARLAEHQAILDGTPAGLAALDAWRAEYVWLPASSRRTKDWLAAHGYRIEVNTTRSFVAVRADLPPLPQGSTQSRPCFPG